MSLRPPQPHWPFDAPERIRQVPTASLVLIIGLAAVGIFLAFYFSRFLGEYLRYPLEGMTVGLKKMTEGDLSYFDNDVEVSKDTKDEMNLHAYYFVELLNATRAKVADTKKMAAGDLTVKYISTTRMICSATRCRRWLTTRTRSSARYR